MRSLLLLLLRFQIYHCVTLRLLVIHFVVVYCHAAINKLGRSPATSLIYSAWFVAATFTAPAAECLTAYAVKPYIGSELRFLPTPHAFDAPVRGRGFPSEYCHNVWYRKTRIAWLPDGEKILKICLFVLTEFTNVTDTETDTQTDTQTVHDDIGRAYA